MSQETFWLSTPHELFLVIEAHNLMNDPEAAKRAEQEARERKFAKFVKQLEEAGVA